MKRSPFIVQMLQLQDPTSPSPFSKGERANLNPNFLQWHPPTYSLLGTSEVAVAEDIMVNPGNLQQLPFYIRSWESLRTKQFVYLESSEMPCAPCP